MNLKQQFQDMLEKKEKLEQQVLLAFILEKHKNKRTLCRIKLQVELCGAKLDRAKRLMQELGGERERWQGAAVHLQEVFSHLLGDILLSSGCIAYLGAYTLPYRDFTMQKWLSLCRVCI